MMRVTSHHAGDVPRLPLRRRVMPGKCVATLPAMLAAIVLGGASLASAPAVAAPGATPAWSVQVVPLPATFSSNDNARCEAKSGEVGFCDHYTIVPTNIGTRTSEGSVTVTDELPEGVTTVGKPYGFNENIMRWECETSTPAAREIVTCVSEFYGEGVPPLSAAAEISIPVVLAPGATGELHSHIEVTGGSAAPLVSEPSVSVGGSTPFGPLGFTTEFLNAAGEQTAEAAAHPASFAASFYLPTAFSSRLGGYPNPNPVQPVKQIVLDLPPGVVGDAQAAAACPLVDVANLKGNQRQCPLDSRIGTLALISPLGTNTELTVFNVQPEHGYAAEFAVYLPLLSRAEMLYAKLVGSGANAHARVISAPQDTVGEEVGISLTFFGDPAKLDGGIATPAAFFTSPSDCSAASLSSTVYVDSWLHPGAFEADGEPNLEDPNWKRASAPLPRASGCEGLAFDPTFTLAPEAGSSDADEPAGYESVLTMPQSEDPATRATPPLKTVTVTLPPGVAISPGAANGLVGCALGPEGIGLAQESEEDQAGHCPEGSKVGEVHAYTPLLKEVLAGGVYVATPPCGASGQPACTEAAAEAGEVYGVFLELGSETSGVHVKVRGKIEVGGAGHRNDLAPGQVRTVFANAPQEPLSELALRFAGGPQAPLANPQQCSASNTTIAELEPWSHIPGAGEKEGSPIALDEPSFAIGGCEDRFAPSFSSGTRNPQGGNYTTLTMTLSRQDREQDLSDVSLELPPGLVGRIASVPECSEAEAVAEACSSVSRIGSATAGAGSGSAPLWQTGSVYLTGPYHGAPFGLDIVVPAVAGPYNLGNVAVRAALYVNPDTAQVRVVSDPFPREVDGVPLRLKTINVTVDRPGFILNPTNCAEQSITASVESTEGGLAPVSSRFEAANCSSLRFSPVVRVGIGHQSTKNGGVGLKFLFQFPSGALGSQASFKAVKFDFPKRIPSRQTTLEKACLAHVFETDPAACGGAVIGHAVVHTPILPVPLTGPVYLVSYGAVKFPSAVMVLQGDNVTIDLTGETFVNGKTGITSATFRTIPDVPFESTEVVLPAGPSSEFTAYLPASTHGSLCGQKFVVPTAIVGQNGVEIHQNTPLGVEGCKKVVAHRQKKRKK